MRLLLLYLRARRAGPTLACILGVAALIWLFLMVSNSEPSTLLILTIMPLGIATVLGVSTFAPFGEMEQSTSHPLCPLRLGHLSSLFLCGMLALGVAGAASDVLDVRWMLLRNGLGYVGLALLAARFVGATNAWIVPVVYGASAFVATTESQWSWPIHPASDQRSLTIALTLAAAGFTIAILLGPRLRDGQSTGDS